MRMNKHSMTGIALAMSMTTLAAFPAKAQTVSAPPSNCPTVESVASSFAQQFLASPSSSNISLCAVACGATRYYNGKTLYGCNIKYDLEGKGLSSNYTTVLPKGCTLDTNLLATTLMQLINEDSGKDLCATGV